MYQQIFKEQNGRAKRDADLEAKSRPERSVSGRDLTEFVQMTRNADGKQFFLFFIFFLKFSFRKNVWTTSAVIIYLGIYRESPDSTVFAPLGNHTIEITILIGD